MECLKIKQDRKDLCWSNMLIGKRVSLELTGPPVARTKEDVNCSGPVHGLMASARPTLAVIESSRLDKRHGLDGEVSSLDLTSLGGSICCIAVADDGTRFVCTASALFAITKNGMQALVAGDKTTTGFEVCECALGVQRVLLQIRVCQEPEICCRG